jgi:peptidoglycan/LPS O-acetylase OafA/YrhL
MPYKQLNILDVVVVHLAHSNVAGSLSDMLYSFVTMFFVLSGFILQHSYRNRNVRPMSFLILRFARIWPAHVAILCLLLIYFGYPLISDWHDNLTVTQAIVHVFLFQSWIPQLSEVYRLNGPAWTLSSLLALYVSFPFMTRLLKSNARLFLFVVMFVVMSFYFVVCLISFTRNLEYYDGLLYTFPISRLAEFCIGMFGYELLAQDVKIKRLIASRSTVCEVVCVFILCIGVYYIEQARLDVITIPKLYGFSRNLAGITTSVLICPVLVVLMQGRGPIARICSLPVVIYLGRISMAIYLLHHPMIYYTTLFSIEAHFIGYNSSTIILACTIVGFAVIIHHCVEVPLYDLVKRHVERWGSVTSPDKRTQEISVLQ